MPSATKYLSLFNAVSGMLWGVVLLRLTILLPLVGFNYASEGVSSLLVWVQSLALLEVVHAAVGLVRSNPITVLMQVASRLFLVWGVLTPFPAAGSHWTYSTMVVAWCITEMIRYPFYWCQLNHYKPQWLEYLRYTLFIVLYPIGASSEMYITYRALPVASYYHPYFAMLMKAVLVIYPPAFYVLYMHMFKMRAKVLGQDKKPKTATATAAAKRNE